MTDIVRPTVNYMRYLKGIHDTKKKPYETLQEMMSNAIDALLNNMLEWPKIDIFTVYKPTQSALMVLDNGTGMDNKTIQNMFSFDSSDKDASDNNGEKGRGKGKMFTEANYLFGLITKTTEMQNFVTVISQDIWSAVGIGEIPKKTCSLDTALDEIAAHMLQNTNVRTSEGIKAVLRQVRARMRSIASGTLVVVACDDRSGGDDGSRSLPLMQTKHLLKNDDLGWIQNDKKLQAQGILSDRKLYTRKLPAVIRYVCSGGSNLYHSDKINLPKLKVELEALAEQYDLEEKAKRFWDRRVEMRPEIRLHTTTDPRGTVIERGYPIEKDAIVLGPLPFLTSTYNFGTITLIVSRTVNWTRENEPLGRNNKYQRCNINYTEMTGIQIRSMGVLKGKLQKIHSREFYDALPVGGESILEQSVQEGYIHLDEQCGGLYTYNLVIDVSQKDIPASSERGSYSAASFTSFIGPENITCMRSIAGILQNFVSESEQLRECFTHINYTQKEENERDGAARDEERLRILQNGERYHFIVPQLCIWSDLAEESFKIPQTEKELEEDYFMWERIMWAKLERGSPHRSLWYKSLSAPSQGSDRICYNRFANPDLQNGLKNNTVDLTDESICGAFVAMEFKKKLVNGMRINHPLDSLDCIVVTELPAKFDGMCDEKRFVCDVKERHATHLILGNIHRNDDNGNSTTPLGTSTMNLKKITVIGLMELLQMSISPNAAIKRHTPTQKTQLVKKGRPEKRMRTS